jgi:hypothetical protein
VPSHAWSISWRGVSVEGSKVSCDIAGENTMGPTTGWPPLSGCQPADPPEHEAWLFVETTNRLVPARAARRAL